MNCYSFRRKDDDDSVDKKEDKKPYKRDDRKKDDKYEKGRDDQLNFDKFSKDDRKDKQPPLKKKKEDPQDLYRNNPRSREFVRGRGRGSRGSLGRGRGRGDYRSYDGRPSRGMRSDRGRPFSTGRWGDPPEHEDWDDHLPRKNKPEDSEGSYEDFSDTSDKDGDKDRRPFRNDRGGSRGRGRGGFPDRRQRDNRYDNDKRFNHFDEKRPEGGTNDYDNRRRDDRPERSSSGFAPRGEPSRRGRGMEKKIHYI